MATPHEQLVAQVRAVYARLHAGALRPDDVMSAADVTFQDPARFAATLHPSRAGALALFDKSFPGFRETYDVFRVFGDESIVLDVGAHWGYSALAMRHQGCKAKIVSIEANSANGSSLDAIKHIEGGWYDWVNVAVGETEGTLRFYIPMLNGVPITGLASTGGTLDDYFADHVAGLVTSYPPKTADKSNEFKLIDYRVRASRLDTILKEHGDISAKVAAVKMDVEGHERPALAGAAELFKAQKPMLMLEGANRNLDTTALLISYGYFHCERHDGKLVPHLAYSLANDGFFVHPDKVDEYRSLGLFTGDVPSAEARATLPQDDGVKRKGAAGQG